MEEGENVRIADFGLARDVPPRRGLQATVGVGTPFYLAPELYGKGGRYGSEVDVYSYGTVHEARTVGSGSMSQASCSGS